MTDITQNLETCTNTLPGFGFISGRLKINKIKSYLIPFLVKERENEPSAIKKDQKFVSGKPTATLDSFPKAHKAS